MIFSSIQSFDMEIWDATLQSAPLRLTTGDLTLLGAHSTWETLQSLQWTTSQLPHTLPSDTSFLHPCKYIFHLTYRFEAPAPKLATSPMLLSCCLGIRGMETSWSTISLTVSSNSSEHLDLKVSKYPASKQATQTIQNMSGHLDICRHCSLPHHFRLWPRSISVERCFVSSCDRFVFQATVDPHSLLDFKG